MAIPRLTEDGRRKKGGGEKPPPLPEPGGLQEANTNVACAVCPKRPTYLRFPHTQSEGREREEENWPTSGFLKPVCEKKGRKRFFNPIYSYVGEFGRGKNILVLCGGIVLHKEKCFDSWIYRQNR